MGWTMSENSAGKIKKRDEKFSARPITRIWEETASADNPYLTTSAYCHGYNWLELINKYNYLDIVFLQLQGELPKAPQKQLFERIFAALSNPGPRHAATWAAMNAGIAKTHAQHFLPIGLTILGGAENGAVEVSAAMRFLLKNLNSDPSELIDTLFRKSSPPVKGDWHIAPGFGSLFDGIDPLTQSVATQLLALPGSGDALRLGAKIVEKLNGKGMGWLPTGLAAAAFVDLGFKPRVGIGLFQLACAPGLLAHAIEMAESPVTNMPFVSDEDYYIEQD